MLVIIRASGCSVLSFAMPRQAFSVQVLELGLGTEVLVLGSGN